MMDVDHFNKGIEESMSSLANSDSFDTDTDEDEDSS